MPEGTGHGCLLVTFRERIGFHQLVGFINHFILAIGFGAADAGLGPEVMVFVDADIAFRCLGNFDAG